MLFLLIFEGYLFCWHLSGKISIWRDGGDRVEQYPGKAPLWAWQISDSGSLAFLTAAPSVEVPPLSPQLTLWNPGLPVTHRSDSQIHASLIYDDDLESEAAGAVLPFPAPSLVLEGTKFLRKHNYLKEEGVGTISMSNLCSYSVRLDLFERPMKSLRHSGDLAPRSQRAPTRTRSPRS